MGTKNFWITIALPATFLVLNSLLCNAYVVPDEKGPDPCASVSVQSYCEPYLRPDGCALKPANYCDSYWKKPICNRGPRAYCQNWATARQCRKVTYCINFTNDHGTVTASPVTPRPRLILGR